MNRFIRTTLRLTLTASLFLAATCSSHLFAQGSPIDINNPSPGSGYTWSSPTLTITDPGTYTITGSGETTNRIAVDPGITAYITIRNVNINVSSISNACAFEIGNGSTVNLTLEGTNTLTSRWSKAGLQAGTGSTLEIRAASDVPSLTASCGSDGGLDTGGAGIGGSTGGSGGTINIYGGTVTANGGINGAGIGGGYNGSGGNINIYGGTVKANSVQYGAGIGGGYGGGSGGTINIYGGTVTASGGEYGAGIGGCRIGSGGTINISGGTVTASGGDYAAGIGGGGTFITTGGSGGTITISGGTVRADGSTGRDAASIGGGAGNRDNGNVIITGGSIYMNNQYGPTPINGAGKTVYLNTLTLSGAGNDISVTAGSIGGVPCAETANAPAGVYGIKDVKTAAGGVLYFYLPPTASGDEPVKLVANNTGYGESYPRDNGSISQTLGLLPYDITLSQTGNHSFGSATYGYATLPTALPVTVTNTGSSSTGELTVTLSGDPSAFTTSAILPSSIGASGSTAGFTVTPKPGLAAGPHTETVTVSGDNDITASFTVSFTVSQKSIAVSGATIDPKTYDGTTDVTVTDITFSVLESGDNLDGDDYTVSNAAFLDPNAGNGDRTVQMDITLSTDPSSPARNYTLSNGTGWQLTSQSISKADLTTDHLSYTLTSATYDGAPHGIAAPPTLKPPYSGLLGTVTVYYTSKDGGISYPKSGTAPVNAGAYTVTVDVTGSANFDDVTNLSLGDFTIGKIPLTAAHLDYTLPNVLNVPSVPYDGAPHGIAAPPRLKPPHTGMGTVLAVYYTGTNGTSYPKSTTAPVNAGEYDVTADISEGAIFSAATSLLLGSYTIAPVTPTLATLAFTLRNATYDDRPHPVTVTPATGITGLGAITVRYNGSTTAPVYPGTYTVTIDIAAGANYTAVTGLPAGTFTISEPTTPVIRRLVTLRSTPGLTTDPPAGSYYINSGTNFTFRLTPDVPSPDGTPPQVHTTRAGAPDGSSGIRITPNADGSYTVVILGIRENIEITLSTPTDNAPVADATLTLGTAPGALVITNTRPDAATVHVYNPAGILVRQTTVPPGTTRLSVPPGIYIVTDGAAFRRKAAVAW